MDLRCSSGTLDIGGLLMTYFALSNVTDTGSFVDGLKYIYDKAPERFSTDIIQGRNNSKRQRCLVDLPGSIVLIGRMGCQFVLLGF